MKYLYLALIVFTLCAILIPPLHYGYVYPTGNDDTYHHLENIEHNENATFPPGYYAPLILAELLPDSPDTAFFWFNYVSLILIALTLWYVASKLFNPLAGILAVWLCMFLTPAFYMLFNQGAIFNLSGLYILGLLSLLTFCLWLRTRRPYHAVLSILLLMVSPLYHPSSFYILVGISVYIFMRLIYEGITRNPSRWLGWYGIGLVLAILGAMKLSLGALGHFIGLYAWYQEGVIGFYDWFAHFASSWGIVLLLLALVMCWYLKVKLPKETLIVLGICFVLWIIGAFTGLFPSPYRAGLDLAIMLSFTTAGVLGIVIKARGSKLFSIAIAGVIVVGAVPMLTHWFANDSAMQPEDIQAVEYINEHGYTWNSSHMVQERIYERYTEPEHLPLKQADVFIWREEPQSCRADPECCWFDKVVVDKPPGTPLLDLGLVKIYNIDK